MNICFKCGNSLTRKSTLISDHKGAYSYKYYCSKGNHSHFSYIIKNNKICLASTSKYVKDELSVNVEFIGAEKSITVDVYNESYTPGKEYHLLEEVISVEYDSMFVMPESIILLEDIMMERFNQYNNLKHFL